MPRFFYADNEDNFVITPAVVLQLGRCEGCQTVAGFSLSLAWLFFEEGLQFEFYHRHD